MTDMTRQEQRYKEFTDLAVRLVRSDGNPAGAEELYMMLSLPATAAYLSQAFSNVLWEEDKRHERDRGIDLAMMIKVIRNFADMDNENSQKIVDYLETEVAESKEDVETMTQAEIDAEVGLEDEDNTPLL